MTPPDVHGLTSDEAATRLVEYGPNEPVTRRRSSAIVQFLRLFANPLVAILAIASAISLFLHETTDAAIIMTIVVAGTVINFWQTYRSERAVERLRASVAATATIERDGAWKETAYGTDIRAGSGCFRTRLRVIGKRSRCDHEKYEKPG